MAVEEADADAPVELRWRTSSEWLLAVCYAIASLGSAWAAVCGFANLTENDLRGGRFAGLFEALFRLIGPLGFRLGVAVVALWTGALAAGALWRLRDSVPAFTADAKGVVFHPSIHRGALEWSDVERIDITGGKQPELMFRLKRRFWSLYVPQTGRSIGLILRAFVVSDREMESLLHRMRRWQRAARHALSKDEKASAKNGDLGGRP